VSVLVLPFRLRRLTGALILRRVWTK
jgi:hypothetical protein